MSGRIRAVTFDPNRVAEYLRENLKKSKDKDKKNLYVDKSLSGYNSGSRH